MTSLHGSAIVAALSGKDTLLIIIAVIGVIVLAFRIKYAPPWWLRRHREQRQQADRTQQPPGDRADRGRDDTGRDG